jgi:acetyl-CoA decarbonylase/synthase complex subunit gamma
VAPNIFEQPFVSDVMETPAGKVPVVPAGLRAADRLHGCRVRWGLGRMHYTVVPGLYALGRPGPDSPVLLTANYKLSFDALRRELGGLDAWLVAVDTNGINVWCAAGKGTMGTDSVARAIRHARLEELVDHRRVILPQLAGPGVAAHRLRRATGFEAVFGPVRAADLPAYLASGRAEAGMRVKEFPLRERAALAPMELVPALKYGLPAALVLWVLGGLGAAGGWWAGMQGPGLVMALGLLLSAAGASVLGPVLLPWLPGRAFAAKGLVLGLGLAAGWLALGGPALAGAGPWSWLGALLVMCASASFLLMNFTGSSTYTGLSGVKREMRLAVPLQIASAAAGLVLWLAAPWLG